MSKKAFIFNKLGRDAIPDLLEKSGIVVHTKKLIDEQLTQALKDKLIEEAHECTTAESIENLKEELADVMEVITAILEHHKITAAEIETIRLAKHKLKGGFSTGTYISHIEVEENHPDIERFKKSDPNYPKSKASPGLKAGASPHRNY
jgi:predicted house-cleaning noncanonical NTP pyrophosphatase (MazG superfamily)